MHILFNHYRSKIDIRYVGRKLFDKCKFSKKNQKQNKNKKNKTLENYT